MARVTGSEVKAVLETDLAVSQVAPFIEGAHQFVNETIDSDPRVSDALEKEIERWLAASLVTAYDPRVSEEDVGDGSVRFQGRSDLGFLSNRYGQHAVQLDPTGKLQRLAQGESKTFRFQVGPLEVEDEL